MKPKQSPDFLHEDAWVAAALDVLAEESIDKVLVEPLAKRLGVTKGSFYWHFRDRSALLDAMLRTWKRRGTLAIIEQLEHSNAAPKERLERLMDAPTAQSFRSAQVELAIRGWARSDKRAAEAVAEVDEQRLAYLTMLLKAVGYDDAEAGVRGYLIYSYMFSKDVIVPEQTPDAQRLRAARLGRARQILIGR